MVHPGSFRPSDCWDWIMATGYMEDEDVRSQKNQPHTWDMVTPMKFELFWVSPYQVISHSWDMVKPAIVGEMGLMGLWDPSSGDVERFSGDPGLEVHP